MRWRVSRFRDNERRRRSAARPGAWSELGASQGRATRTATKQCVKDAAMITAKCRRRISKLAILRRVRGGATAGPATAPRPPRPDERHAAPGTGRRSDSETRAAPHPELSAVPKERHSPAGTSSRGRARSHETRRPDAEKGGHAASKLVIQRCARRKIPMATTSPHGRSERTEASSPTLIWIRRPEAKVSRRHARITRLGAVLHRRPGSPNALSSTRSAYAAGDRQP